MITQKRELKYTICFCLSGDRVLVLYRNNPPNIHTWNGLGGKIELGETPTENIIREMREEAELDLSQAIRLKCSGIVTWNTHKKNGDMKMGGMYCFIATYPEHTFFEDRETREGKLSWKKTAWVIDPKNSDVTDNISYFLPRMLASDTPQEYHCTYHDTKLVGFEMRSLKADPQGVIEK